MENGIGPHNVISNGEVNAFLVVMALAAVAFIWMAYGTRRRVTTTTTTANTVTTRPKPP